MFSDYNDIKLETNNKRKFINMWKFEDTPLYN